MPITHAMEATRDQRKVKVVRHKDDTYTVVMLTGEPGKIPIVGGYRLSREALVLLSESLAEFIQNIDQFEIIPEDVE